tara:strand:- start:2292 stop:2813 length:522 start_codon:yes stop_codon:yes gene_type:complete
MEAKNVFEFGSGFSSKTMLLALEETGGKLISCDYRPLSLTAKTYDGDSEEMTRLSERWRYIQKRSTGALNDISGEIFDVVLHDGSHTWTEVADDLGKIIPYMKKGGILMVHDTNHPTDNYQLDKSVDAIDFSCSDSGYDIERLTLPYGYGLTIIRVMQDFGNGEVNIAWRKGQ